LEHQGTICATQFGFKSAVWMGHHAKDAPGWVHDASDAP
jgi:hypothetical protein